MTAELAVAEPAPAPARALGATGRVRRVPALEPPLDPLGEGGLDGLPTARARLRAVPDVQLPFAPVDPAAPLRGLNSPAEHSPGEDPPLDTSPEGRASGHRLFDPMDEFWGPQQTRRRDLPDPIPVARRFLQATLEVLAGYRPVAQLRGSATPEVFTDIARRSRRAGLGAGTGQVPRSVVRTVRSAEPADGAAEVSAVISRGGRCRAVAARFEGIDGRWMCVVLQIG